VVHAFTVSTSRLSWGVTFGSAHLEGDRETVIPGFSAQVAMTYQLSDLLRLSAGLGYTELRYIGKESSVENATDILNTDIRANFWSPPLAENWQAYGGFGLSFLGVKVRGADFRRFWDAAVAIGAGVSVSHEGTSVIFGIDYRFVMADTIDSLTLGSEGATNDGFLTTRFGLQWTLGRN
jgi:hypothetical protein